MFANSLKSEKIQISPDWKRSQDPSVGLSRLVPSVPDQNEVSLTISALLPYFPLLRFVQIAQAVRNFPVGRRGNHGIDHLITACRTLDHNVKVGK